jgi:predicted Zn-dependent protease
VGNCGPTTYTPNYVADISLLLHWPGFPLRVFFTRDAEYSPARQSVAQAGFDQWSQATNNRTPYVVVTDAGQADVVVTFETYTSGDTLGKTIDYYRGDTIERAEMDLLFTNQRAQDQLTAAHEWGHALGIMDHSSNPADLMNAFGNGDGCGCVTQSDLNTLLTAYCNDFSTRSLPRRREELGPLRSVTIH